MKSHRFLLPVFAAGFAVACAAPLAAQSRKPNVIVILADDLGFSDLGVQGGKDIPTPNIDSLARNGIRNGKVACQPARSMNSP